jgi:hypothetical protein
MQVATITFHYADDIRADAIEIGDFVSLFIFPKSETWVTAQVSFTFRGPEKHAKASRIARAINETMGEVAESPSKGDDDAI